MERYEKDGKTAILYTPMISGWYTKHQSIPLIFDPKIIKGVLQKEELLKTLSPNSDKVKQVLWNMSENLDDWIIPSLEHLAVRWLDQGEKFRIVVGDLGGETIELLTETRWLEA